MSYKSILVCLDQHRTNASLMKVSADLAFKLDAKAVGIAVSQPLLVGSENVYVPADVFDDHYKQTEARILVLQTTFEQAMTATCSVCFKLFSFLRSFNGVYQRKPQP
jgi:hypothetical protein